MEAIEAAAEAEPLRLGPGAVDGQFELLLNTTNYLDDDACTTLGTLTFQQFGPSDLRVRPRALRSILKGTNAHYRGSSAHAQRKFCSLHLLWPKPGHNIK